eukprot:TRINITY_DN16998_c0_g1_i1.p1 TRINITY_DN16998_c0_g1~~TRINITY_DN16998_c0_g1_i1.p1  ORF type:complete len:532 (-),score=41.96 TRINITY_DN16998_c0_g1_i1:239-1717(-)
MAFIDPDESVLSHEKQKNLPQVSLILAVKGVGDQGVANWRSQLVTLYGGPLEFLFCVESKEDPAYPAVQALAREMHGFANIRLVVAGLASHCSQQIHNQLAGARAASLVSKYILFLDDDIQCHPGTIGSLVRTMEARPDVLVATGYSFDVPSQPSLAAYAAMSYRLPLLVGLSSGARVFFVWGGCIFVRTADLRSDRYGMMTALQQNGYSNDLILTSIAGVNKRAVWSTPVSIFPGRMSGEWSFRRYWNYVRRQMFALTTYCSWYSYRTNRMGLLSYVYLAWACVLPLAISFLQLGLWQLSMLWAVVSWIDDPSLVITLPVPGRSWEAWNSSPAACAMGLTMSAVNLLCAGFLTICAMHLFSAVLALCNKLSPQAPPLRPRHLSLPLCIAGMAVNLFMLPVIAGYTYFKPDISWMGIKYVRKNGVVAKVTHPGEDEDVGYMQAQVSPGGTLLVEKLAAGPGRKPCFQRYFIGPVVESVSRALGMPHGQKKVG